MVEASSSGTSTSARRSGGSSLKGTEALSEGTAVGDGVDLQPKRPADAHPCLYAGQTAVVVGGGLAGGLAAGFLAEHGFHVKVFEKRTDPLEEGYSQERATGIRLFPEAVQTLKQAGVDIPSDGLRYGISRAKSVMLLSGEGVRTIPVKGDPASFASIAERNQYNTMITETIRKRHADSVTFVFRHKCTSVDFDLRSITFQDSDGAKVTEDYDLLVAADGIHSTIRKELQRSDPSFKVTSFPHERGYKIVRDLPPVDGHGEISENLKLGCLAFTEGSSDGSDDVCLRTFTLLVRPSPTGTFHVLVTTPYPDIFDLYKGREYEWLKPRLPSAFPEAWLKEVCDRLPQVPLSRTPPVQKVSRLYGAATVFIGDAGHGATAAMGLGANAAIRDAQALGEALQEANGDLEAVGRIFDRDRLGPVQAMLSLQLVSALLSVASVMFAPKAVGHEYITFPWREMWTKFVGWVDLTVMGCLRSVFPRVVPPTVDTLVTFGILSPVQAARYLQAEGAIAAGENVVNDVVRQWGWTVGLGVGLVAVLFKVGVIPAVEYLLANKPF